MYFTEESSWLSLKSRIWNVSNAYICLIGQTSVLYDSLNIKILFSLSRQYGLYSAFMGCLIYILFGTSKDVTLGPTAIMSLLTAEFAHSPVEGDATYAILLSLIGGIIQLGMSILNIGTYARS